jgi:hypothetical protein
VWPRVKKLLATDRRSYPANVCAKQRINNCFIQSFGNDCDYMRSLISNEPRYRATPGYPVADREFLLKPIRSAASSLEKRLSMRMAMATISGECD